MLSKKEMIFMSEEKKDDDIAIDDCLADEEEDEEINPLTAYMKAYNELKEQLASKDTEISEYKKEVAMKDAEVQDLTWHLAEEQSTVKPCCSCGDEITVGGKCNTCVSLLQIENQDFEKKVNQIQEWFEDHKGHTDGGMWDELGNLLKWADKELIE
jgi:hypothetical protein